MDYLIILFLQLIGIMLHVAQKVKEIDARSDEDTIREVLDRFIIEEWLTLAVSFIIIMLNLVGHYVIDAYTDIPYTIENYSLYAFGLSLVLGYSGQRIVYKYLGHAENVINKQIDK